MKKIWLFTLAMAMVTSVSFAAEKSSSTTGNAVTTSVAATPSVAVTPIATATTSTPAKTASSSSSAEGQAYLGIGVGGDIPVSPSTGNAGLGGEVMAGYSFDKNMAIQLEVDNFIVRVDKTAFMDAFDVYELRPLAEFKYTFDSKDVFPYVFVGAGVNMEMTTADTTTNFDAVGGLGVQYDLGNKVNLYLQAKYNFIFATGTTTQDLPIEAGVVFNL
jgi:hypothetical protein